MTCIRTSLRIGFCLLVGAAALTGCTRDITNRGYLFDEEAMAQLSPGVDNKSSVTAVLGSPSAQATFDENHWYYVYQEKEYLAFFRPDLTDHRILVISFNERGTLADMSELGIDAVNDIEIVAAATPTRGRELGFFEQIFGNIGRFGGSGPVQPGY